MTPILNKLKGRPIAFACRLMDGESSDYATELVALFLNAGCVVPELIKTSLNDFPGSVVITNHGKVESEIVQVLASAFEEANIPVRIEPVQENTLGVWY